MMTDEEYEAELQARTPEQWAAMKEKSIADVKDINALQHLWWRRDVKDQEYLMKLGDKPGGMTLEDRDYFCRQIGEIADTLRAARDNPERRERDRWFKVMSAASMVASNTKGMEEYWLEVARDSFPANRGPYPGEDAPPLAQAIYAVECLLDALLLKPEQRAELEEKMKTAFMGWCDENGIRRVSFPGTKYDQALQKQRISRPTCGARFNANGQGEMFGAEIVPLNHGGRK